MSGYAAINGDDSHGPRPGSPGFSRRRRSRHGKDNGIVGQASWISSIINLLNTIVGAGVLAMPHALSNMGIVLGLFVILWAGLTAGFGLYLQTRCARYLERGSASFFALSQMTYPNAAVIFDTAIAVKCFGVGISYLIIIGDLMPGVVQGFSNQAEGFLVDRRFWVTAFMSVRSVAQTSQFLALWGPFADCKGYTSVIALISIGYLVILVVAHFIMKDTMQERGDIRVFRWAGPIPTVASFPVMVFAYTCHQNMFSILNEIKDNAPRRTTSVVVASVGTAATIYLLVAITGYLSFGNNIAGNIVAQYAPSIASTTGKAAIVVLVMFSYPLQVHPCRASVDAVLRWRPRRTSNRNASMSHSPESPTRESLLLASSKPSGQSANGRSEPMGETRFAAITTLIIVLSYIVAMTVSSLEKVLAYVGSTGSTSISFILPGLFYYKISSPHSPHHQRLVKEDDDGDESSGMDGSEEGPEQIESWRMGRQWRRKLLRRLSMALAVYGVIVMVTCLVTNTFFIVAH